MCLVGVGAVSDLAVSVVPLNGPHISGDSCGGGVASRLPGGQGPRLVHTIRGGNDLKGQSRCGRCHPPPAGGGAGKPCLGRLG